MSNAGSCAKAKPRVSRSHCRVPDRDRTDLRTDRPRGGAVGALAVGRLGRDGPAGDLHRRPPHEGGVAIRAVDPMVADPPKSRARLHAEAPDHPQRRPLGPAALECGLTGNTVTQASASAYGVVDCLGRDALPPSLFYGTGLPACIL